MTSTILTLTSDQTHQAELNDILNAHYKLITCDTLDKASAYLDQGIPKLIILPVNADTQNTVSTLSDNPLWKWIPLLFVASPDQLHAAQTRHLLEAHDYTLAPLVSSDLLLRVKKHLMATQIDVLIVNHNDENSDILQQHLSKNHFSTKTANTPEQAKNLLTLVKFNSIVANARFVDESFSDLFDFLQHSDQNTYTPVLLTVPESDIATVRKDLLDKANDHLVEPVNEIALLMRLKRLTPIPAHQALLIDFSENYFDELKQWLRQMDIDLTVARTPDSVATQLENKAYDIVLWDISALPENANQLLSDIQDRLQDKPLVFLSSQDDLALHSNLVIKGTDFVVKPLNQEKLSLRLQRLLNQAIDTETEALSEREDPVFLDLNDTGVLNGNPKITINHSPQQVEVASENGLHHHEKSALLDQIKVGLNHEIRNPLTSILIGSQALVRRYEEDCDEKQIALEIEKASKRIKTILNAMGNMEKYIVEDYVGDIKMLSFTEATHD